MLPDTIEVRPFDAYGFACRGLFAKVDMPAGNALGGPRRRDVVPINGACVWVGRCAHLVAR